MKRYATPATSFRLLSILAALILGHARGFAQVQVPQGTKLRVRLETAISSATAQRGQIVDLSVTEAVTIGDVTVFPEGAHVTGTITEAHERRRLGRSGKLDFSIDRAKAADEQWVALRYTSNRQSGQSHAVLTGVLTAGVAVAFWPAAPVFLLIKGKDTVINKGVCFDVFTDAEHQLGPASTISRVMMEHGAVQSMPPIPPPPAPPVETASVNITSPVMGAEIELDGQFVGNTPTVLQVNSGLHRVTVKSGSKIWDRTMQINSGSVVSLNANFQ